MISAPNTPRPLSRRHFLAASAAVVALPRLAFAQTAPLALTATRRSLEIDGKAASVYGLVNGSGGNGLILDPGQRFSVNLTNALDEESLIHWHGQIPPNAQDGVPGMPAPLMKPGESRSYDFAAKPGTHWMHAHVPLQELNLLAAPLIVRTDADLKADRQEVVMLLHDFSFKSPAEVMAEITGGAAMGGMTGMDMSGADASKMGDMKSMDMSGMKMPGMDLNDYNFDAYLTNDRTLSDPEVVRVEAGGHIHLRIINGAAATVFWIDIGVEDARLIAVDGHNIAALKGRRFGLAMGQRLDIELDLPGSGMFPILALREGAKERTGLILATPGAAVPKLASVSDEAAPAFDPDLSQESALRAAHPLTVVNNARSEMLMLAGAMVFLRRGPSDDLGRFRLRR